jgi:long-chain acyl-CoA synthetase
LTGNPAFRTYLKERVEAECNRKVARYQTIKRFEILANEFSVDSGELTPTMKIKRNAVHEKYKARIEVMYANE